jgi:hypothetical protein
MQLKNASDMTEAELRAEVELLEARRAKRLAYSRARNAALTPEQRAKQRMQRMTYAAAKRAREAEVMARAAALTSDKTYFAAADDAKGKKAPKKT